MLNVQLEGQSLNALLYMVSMRTKGQKEKKKTQNN